MFSKKKILDMLFISLLISLVVIISFFNLISEEQMNENFAGTVLYIIIFVSAAVIAYLLCDRALGLFLFGYFALVCLCFLFGFAIELFDLGYNFIAFVCSLLIAPFYGFMYASDSNCWMYISFAAAVILCLVSGIVSFLRKKDRSRE